jgi:sulfoxide reductase heme-binding subunit YedZ
LQKLAKPLIFVAALTPALWLAFRTYSGRLSANPIEDLTLTTGIWTLRLLVITLAITPLRRITGWNRLIQYRRMLGLFAFFYAFLHFVVWLVDRWLDPLFGLQLIFDDIAKRPFITMGMLAFVLMVPLALTSTKGWIRRLGKRWTLLHRLIYISAIAAAIHYLWKVKVAVGSPVYYAAIVGALLAFRLICRNVILPPLTQAIGRGHCPFTPKTCPLA